MLFRSATVSDQQKAKMRPQLEYIQQMQNEANVNQQCVNLNKNIKYKILKVEI